MQTYLAGVAAYMEAGGPSASQRPVNQQSQRQAEVRAHSSRSTQAEQSVVVEFSSEALQAAKERSMADLMTEVEVQGPAERPEGEHEQASSSDAREIVTQETLSVEERAALADLERRDHTVRTRDMAYVAAAGGLAGSFSVQYETGPDGRRYAVDAKVALDTSTAPTPEQSLAKAKALRAAAMSASGDASAIARANTMEAQARSELASARAALERAYQASPEQQAEPALPSGSASDVEAALPEVELHVEGTELSAESAATEG